jgi:DNA mismatch endonuclease (patch repair protein)
VKSDRSWPVASSSVVSRKLSSQKVRDTGPEMALRRELFRIGLRYRLQRRPIVGLNRTADLVFGRAKVAIDVRGCFWHACPEHGNFPRVNSAWWAAKLRRNVERDAETVAAWEAAGWRVVIVWEHEDPASAARRVEMIVRSAGAHKLAACGSDGRSHAEEPLASVSCA